MIFQNFGPLGKTEDINRLSSCFAHFFVIRNHNFCALS